jgi:hypothetical protein
MSYSFAKGIAWDDVSIEASNTSEERSTIVNPICVSTHVLVLLVLSVLNVSIVCLAVIV